MKITFYFTNGNEPQEHNSENLEINVTQAEPNPFVVVNIIDEQVEVPITNEIERAFIEP